MAARVLHSCRFLSKKRRIASSIILHSYLAKSCLSCMQGKNYGTGSHACSMLILSCSDPEGRRSRMGIREQKEQRNQRRTRSHGLGEGGYRISSMLPSNTPNTGSYSCEFMILGPNTNSLIGYTADRGPNKLP